MGSLLTAEAVSKILNCKISTIYSWYRSGKLRGGKIHGLLRFRSEDIDELISSSMESPQAAKHIRIKRPLDDRSVDMIVKKTIDSVKRAGYNSSVKEETMPRKTSPERRR